MSTIFYCLIAAAIILLTLPELIGAFVVIAAAAFCIGAFFGLLDDK